MDIMEGWEYYNPENDMTIHGMERILDSGSALDVIAYGTRENPSDFSWMIRIWNETSQSYIVRGSYDDDQWFSTIEDAYEALTRVLVSDYPYLVEGDEIMRDPEKARSKFFSAVVAFGLAAAFAITTLTGCGGMAVAAPELPYNDVPLGSAGYSVSYSQVLASDAEYAEYEAVVDIMASGENPDVSDDGSGWYEGDFTREELSVEPLRYATYDNPLFSIYRNENAQSGLVVNSNGDIRIHSTATEQGDDFNRLYDQAMSAANPIISQAQNEANGSTAAYVESITRQVAERVSYSYDESYAHANDIYGALVDGSSRCFGYACSIKYMLDAQGVPNFIATGHAGGERHSWNMVEIGGTWLVVDATLTSTMIEDENAGTLSECANPGKYCLRTLDDLTESHEAAYVIDDVSAMLMA